MAGGDNLEHDNCLVHSSWNRNYEVVSFPIVIDNISFRLPANHTRRQVIISKLKLNSSLKSFPLSWDRYEMGNLFMISKW